MNLLAKSLEKTYTIRDAVHGTVRVSKKELGLIKHPTFGRLRNIKQLGFTDFAFPGATHSRFSHSIGAMHLATRIFDHLFKHHRNDNKKIVQLRQALRLAMLFHDIGHAPFSHATEKFMPSVHKLGLFLDLPDRKATHEDYTLKILTDSSFSNTLDETFAEAGISSKTVSQIALSDESDSSDWFYLDGINFLPLLRQIVSSECDADRMDYLLRDSFYCGVNYGKFDLDWLLDNFVPVEQHKSVYLGLKSKATFSLEDFLLSRYHMFASVYLHHSGIIFEKMLSNFLKDEPHRFVLPSDIEAYIKLDDHDLRSAFKNSSSTWAKRIVENKPYVLLYEHKTGNDQNKVQTAQTKAFCDTLEENNIDFITSYSKGLLSKYYGTLETQLFIVENSGEVFTLEDYSPLYERYKQPAVFQRVFVAPDKKDQATKLLDEFKKRGANHV